jgi:hypothetical protein
MTQETLYWLKLIMGPYLICCEVDNMQALEFRGLGNGPARCGLDIHRRHDGIVVVILTELPNNPGTSVTNFFEHLATKVFMEILMMEAIKPANIIWIEHYPAESREPIREETWDKVELMYHDEYKRFQRPKWSRLQKEEVDAILSE